MQGDRSDVPEGFEDNMVTEKVAWDKTEPGGVALSWPLPPVGQAGGYL